MSESILERVKKDLAKPKYSTTKRKSKEFKTLRNGKNVWLCKELVHVSANGGFINRPCNCDAHFTRIVANEVVRLCEHHAKIWDQVWESALTNSNWDEENKLDMLKRKEVIHL